MDRRKRAAADGGPGGLFDHRADNNELDWESTPKKCWCTILVHPPNQSHCPVANLILRGSTPLGPETNILSGRLRGRLALVVPVGQIPCGRILVNVDPGPDGKVQSDKRCLPNRYSSGKEG